MEGHSTPVWPQMGPPQVPPPLRPRKSPGRVFRVPSIEPFFGGGAAARGLYRPSLILSTPCPCRLLAPALGWLLLWLLWEHGSTADVLVCHSCVGSLAQRLLTRACGQALLGGGRGFREDSKPHKRQTLALSWTEDVLVYPLQMYMYRAGCCL